MCRKSAPGIFIKGVSASKATDLPAAELYKPDDLTGTNKICFGYTNKLKEKKYCWDLLLGDIEF